MSEWNAVQYLKFGDERTRPSLDLVSRIELDSPKRIVDLGCGPGNSTQVLKQRWPDAELQGIDHSPKMIEAAREYYPNQNWLLAEIASWRPEHPVDLMFSNAALQCCRITANSFATFFSKQIVFSPS